MLSFSLMFSLSSSDHNIQAMKPLEFKEQLVHQTNPVQNLIPFYPAYKTHLSSNAQPMELSNNCLKHSNPLQNQEWSSNFSSRFLPNSSHTQFHVPAVDIFSPNASSHSTGSTFDEVRESRVNIINEKRLKRVISNRESARRSRMRKKKLIEELQFQVNQVQTVNHQLSEKLIRLLESNHQILQENAQLKEKVSSLQIVLSDLLAPLRGSEGVNGIANINHLRAEASSLSIHQ